MLLKRVGLGVVVLVAVVFRFGRRGLGQDERVVMGRVEDPGALVGQLFVGLALEQTHQDHGHVVTAEAAHLAIGGEASGHEFFADLI